MDKLKYVKIENEDGSLSDNIPLGVDAENVDTENGRNLKEDLTSVMTNMNLNNSEIDALKIKVDAVSSGAPLAANGVEAMIDKERIYVNTQDGYWYFYNGSTWEKGEIYQSTRASNVNGTLLWNLETSLQNLINVNRGDLIDFSQEERILGFLNHQGVGGDNDNNGMYGRYEFTSLKKGTMFYITFGMAVALMPLFLIIKESDGSVVQAYPEEPISGFKTYHDILVEIPEDGCKLVIQDTTSNKGGLSVYKNTSLKKEDDELNGSIDYYKNKKGIMFGELEKKLQENFNLELEEIDFKKEGEYHENETFIYAFFKELIKFDSHTSYNYYKIPLEKGETYLFGGGSLYQVPSVLIADSSLKMKKASAYFSSSILNPIGNHLIYSCTEDNLFAYISEVTTTNAKGLIYMGKITNFKEKNDITLIKKYDKSFFHATVLSENVFSSSKAFANGTYYRGVTYQYLMTKGVKYKAISKNYSDVIGILITDLDYNIIYKTSSENIGNTTEEVEYTWTAEQSGYIFLSDEFPNDSSPYSKLIVINDYDTVNNNNNILFEKTAIFDGDSICQGDSFENYSRYGWAGRIGTRNNMVWKNYGVGGGTVVTDTYYHDLVTDTSNLNWESNIYYKKVPDASSTTEMFQIISKEEWNEGIRIYTRRGSRHWESTNLENMYSEYPQADYIILESCLNDGFNSVPIGEVSNSFNTSYITTNFSSAMEHMIRQAITLWPNSKIGVIIPYQVKNSNIPKYHEKTREICKKWGIPYLDLEQTSNINPYINEQLTLLFSDGGVHINADGYEYIYNKIETWMKSL